MNKVVIAGAGLAGCEAALSLAKKCFSVTLIDMKPHVANSDVYHLDGPAELVCSNSLKSESEGTASKLLKDEMRVVGCRLLQIAEKCAVAAGASLAVDRKRFSLEVKKALEADDNITMVYGKAFTSVAQLQKEFSADYYIVATGPLTESALLESIAGKKGYFYDAIAPLVTLESLDMSKLFWGSRYDKGDPDFLNVPMDKDQYLQFVEALLTADKLPYNEMEKPRFFERCMPIEELARRGEKTLSFGPFRPVGFSVEGKRPWAVVQLRSENRERTVFNLVGCQTRMRQKAQREVFGMLPGFEQAEFVRYGSVHRNSFIDAPTLIDNDLSLKHESSVYVAGQLSGVEGYVESILSGLFVACSIAKKAAGKTFSLPSTDTMTGGIFHKLLEQIENFQPVNANFSLITIPNTLRKKERKLFYGQKGLENFTAYWKEHVEEDV